MPTEFRMTTRHLSAAETVTDIMQGFGANQLLHAAIIRSNAPITEAMLNQSLKILTQHQPALRMKISTERRQNGGTKRRFAELDDVSIDVEVVRGTDRRSWVPIAQSELSVPITAHIGPLWRVKYVDFAEIGDSGSVMSESTARSEALVEGALLFIIHQAIADGISIFHMLQTQLIPILNAVIGGEDTTHFQAPLLMLHSADVAFLDKGKKQWNRKSISKAAPLSADITPDISTFRPLMSCVPRNAEPTATSGSGVLPFSVSALGTKILLEECKKQNTSFHSALLACCSSALSVLSETVPDMYATEEMLIGFSVDLRQFRTRDDAEPLGMWEGYRIEKVKRYRNLPSAEKFWEEARRVCSSYRSTGSKPWKVLNAYNETLKRIEKEGDISAIADMFRVHLQLDNIGNCDGLGRGRSKDDSQPSTSTSRSSRTSSIEEPLNGYSSRTRSSRSSRSSSIEGQRNGVSFRQNGHSRTTSSERPQDGFSFRPKRHSATSSIEEPSVNGSQLNGSSVTSFGDFIRFDEHFFMRSMSDINTVPIVVSSCVFRGRLMCTVTHNTRWVTRRFATEYVDTLIRVIKHVTHPLNVRSSRLSTLPPYWRAKAMMGNI